MTIYTKLIYFLLFLLFFTNGYSQPVDFTRHTHWSDSVCNSLSLEDKIAQMVMIRAHSNYSEKQKKEILNIVENWHVGGICFFQGGPVRQAIFTNRLQNVSKIPLLISIDGEYGVAMRLDSCIRFPLQMSLGAINDAHNYLIYQMGKEIACQCKALGIHINFAPDIDMNTNPNNPVINSRSFGEDRISVTNKGISYISGMQENGISACVKHFPGHGDTDVDSHADLPSILKSRQELNKSELYPFKKTIEENVDMVMVGHLNVPALDSDSNSITSLSHKTITGLLRDELDFKGIIITDALEMSGIRKSYPDNAEAEIKAIIAGVDILLLPSDVEAVITGIKEAVISGLIPESAIHESCRKILLMKEKKNLKTFTAIQTDNIYEKMNSRDAKNILLKLRNESITLLKASRKDFDIYSSKLKPDILFCGKSQDEKFYEDIAKLYNFRKVNINDINTNNSKNPLIIALFGTNQSANKMYGIDTGIIEKIEQVASKRETYLFVFANPYSFNFFKNISNFNYIFACYEPYPDIVECAFEALTGKIDISGKLPVSTKHFKANSGININSKNNDAISLIEKKNQDKIDAIIDKAIKDSVFPGCQVFASHKNKIILSKSYGFLTYDDNNLVNNTTLYDVASLTKIVATTLAIMKLYDGNNIYLTDKIGKYIPYLRGTDKENITVLELLTHTSGLPAFIPFYQEIAKQGIWDTFYLHTYYSDIFSIEVAENVWLNSSYFNIIHQKIFECPLRKKEYLYSDLNFVLLKEIIETVTNTPFGRYMDSVFYEPLCLHNTCFNPLQHNKPLSNIAPTENDAVFRKQVLCGYVHDQTAAIFGGISGNAGIFSTATDLSIIMSMIASNGEYKSKRYFNSETVKMFTSTKNINNSQRTALGFDTPNFIKKGLLPDLASPKTFGHTGFTGTCIWYDPCQELLFIFLSNRIYPKTSPNKLVSQNIRGNIHNILYQSILQ